MREEATVARSDRLRPVALVALSSPTAPRLVQQLWLPRSSPATPRRRHRVHVIAPRALPPAQCALVTCCPATYHHCPRHLPPALSPVLRALPTNPGASSCSRRLPRALLPAQRALLTACTTARRLAQVVARRLSLQPSVRSPPASPWRVVESKLPPTCPCLEPSARSLSAVHRARRRVHAVDRRRCPQPSAQPSPAARRAVVESLFVARRLCTQHSVRSTPASLRGASSSSRRRPRAGSGSCPARALHLLPMLPSGALLSPQRRPRAMPHSPARALHPAHRLAQVVAHGLCLHPSAR